MGHHGNQECIGKKLHSLSCYKLHLIHKVMDYKGPQIRFLEELIEYLFVY